MGSGTAHFWATLLWKVFDHHRFGEVLVLLLMLFPSPLMKMVVADAYCWVCNGLFWFARYSISVLGEALMLLLLPFPNALIQVVAAAACCWVW